MKLMFSKMTAATLLVIALASPSVSEARRRAIAPPAPTPTPAPLLREVTCPDYNRDGTVNSADISAFRTDFMANNPATDFDHDGRVEPEDMAGFINNFYAYLQNPLPNLCGSGSSGWTALNPSADSMIIYVSTTGCNDNNPAYPTSSALIGADPRHPVGAVLPVCTVAAAYGKLRDNFPDWMLLKKGDTWTLPATIDLTKAGRAATERQVIASYNAAGNSSTVRPVVIAPSASHIFYSSDGYANGGNSPSHFALVGLDFKPRAGQEWNNFAIEILGSDPNVGVVPPHSFNLLFEDNRFTKFYSAFVLQGVSDVSIRRNVFVDVLGGYNSGQASMGNYLAISRNFLFEENIILQRFFAEAGIRNPSGFDTNFYCQDANGGNNGDITFQRNVIISKGEYNHLGLELRCPVNAVDNFIYGYGIGLSIAYSDPGNDTWWPNGTHGTVSGNVIEHGVNQDQANPLASGINIGFTDTVGYTISDNIIAHKHSGNSGAAAINISTYPWITLGVRNTNFVNNIFYNWGGLGIARSPGSNAVPSGNRFLNNQVQNPGSEGGDTPLIDSNSFALTSAMVQFSGNQYGSARSASSWFDVGPDGTYRSLAQWQASFEPTAVNQQIPYPNANADHLLSYGATQGLNNIDAIMNALAAQSRDTWNSNIEIDDLLGYTRASFGR